MLIVITSETVQYPYITVTALVLYILANGANFVIFVCVLY
jgi:hypothetical protein